MVWPVWDIEKIMAPSCRVQFSELKLIQLVFYTKTLKSFCPKTNKSVATWKIKRK